MRVNTVLTTPSVRSALDSLNVEVREERSWQGAGVPNVGEERNYVTVYLTLHCCPPSPRGLPFTWWGCCGLLFFTSTSQACPLRFIPFLCLFLSLRPFQLYFIPPVLPTALRFLTLFFRCCFCLIGPFNSVSLWKCPSARIEWFVADWA